VSQKRLAAAIGNGALATKDIAALPSVLTVAQAAEFLQTGTNTVYELVWSKQLDSFKIGSTIRITRKSVAKFCGLDEADVELARERRRAEVDALLARYRIAADECSRVTARLLELGVALAEPPPR